MRQNADGQDLIDPYGRTVRDLRISVTDRCNFRCQYCMPAEGMQWLPRTEILSFEEIERFARICVSRFGFNGIRLTGGEPLVRAHLPDLVDRLAGLGVDIALTTNGATLRLHAAALVAAGLKRINISLDSLQRERFLELTRRDELDRVLDGVDSALDAGLQPVKINVVMMRGINDDEIVDFAEYGRAKGVTVRFIEFMPLEAGDVTKPFCGNCDRVRLTAEGQFRTCLFAVDEFDMRSLLRDEASDEAIADAISAAVGTKWAGHSIGQVNFIRPKRTMSQIGG
jgi:cyclic pyranopterin phosphate synthase